ncbi:MAG: 4-(cytidine 5'-diphospho)-2-C-methyl-D-erythritol kinase [Oscillospiraceae bacterium]|jgi:4-diphosphocytidyl-2-C-methyl-D-erythritol kinase|nr:4-(cytidine 5'-diphospho)-2-C-methyl-D-erythritol kinase [Oscillospiraceae bacterium]
MTAAYAKLNLTLDVLAKRADGYHDLCSVMLAVSLCDDIRLRFTGDSWKLSCDAEAVPCDARNLAWKAAEAFFASFGERPRGLRMEIVKRIPSGAGLGGGSADAAAVLRMLNAHYALPFDLQTLCAIGAQVGSDVPFCVMNGAALAQGRGEILTPLEAAGKLFFVICKPDFPLYTPALFQKLDAISIAKRPNTQAMIDALRRGDAEEIGALLCNVFEQAAQMPEIADIKRILLSRGACGAQMTGSGSAVFGIFRTREQAQTAANSLRESYLQVFVAENV